MERGLSGERQKAVNEVVEGNKAWLEYEPCAISEIWFEECGQLTTDELNANWKFIEECNNPHLIVWEHNNKVYCHHKIPADEHENVDGSMIFDDAGGNIKSGVWKVKVLDVGRKIGEATCNVP